MKRIAYPIPIEYLFDPTHKGAPYTIDGGAHWLNFGQLCEVLDKACKGLTAAHDGNGKWNECSDIAETATSVKSSRATLASDLTGDNMDEMLGRYFAEVHSTNWDYVALLDDEVIIYNMNAEEFREMLMTWASINERKVIRFKSTSAKMLRWLDERVG